jgi:hypothetical protein
MVASSPQEVWLIDRDVSSGAFSNLRVIYSNPKSINSFFSFFKAVFSFGAGNASLAWTSSGLVQILLPPYSNSTLLVSSQLPDEDPQMVTSMQKVSASADGKCIYATASEGIGWWITNVNSSATGRMSGFNLLELPFFISSSYFQFSRTGDENQTRIFLAANEGIIIFERNTSSCELRVIGYVYTFELIFSLDALSLTLSPDERTVLVGFIIDSQTTATQMIKIDIIAKNDGTGEEILELAGYLPVPYGSTLRVYPFFTPDSSKIILIAGLTEVFIVHADDFLATLSPNSSAQWPDTLSFEKIQTGDVGGTLFAATSSDGQFLYTTGATSDMFMYKLEQHTGRRTDGGTRFFTDESYQALLEATSIDRTELIGLMSITLSTDANQTFLYAAGNELHSFTRNTSTGALSDRDVFPLIPTSGAWGTPVYRSDPSPHLIVPDGLALCKFDIDSTTGILIVPLDDSLGVLFNVSAEYIQISSLVVDSDLVYIGAGARSIFVHSRDSTGSISSYVMQTHSLGPAAATRAVVALLITPLFLYSFDDGGTLLVHSRGSNLMLSTLQIAPAVSVSPAVYTSAVALWSNSAQDVIIVGLGSSDIFMFRRNVATGFVDSPTALVPPGKSSNIFRGQGKVVSVAVAGGAVFVTTNAPTRTGVSSLLQFETNNFILLSNTSTDDGSADSAPVVDWMPAMRLQFSSPGSPYDGQYISYRPSLSSFPPGLTPIYRCAAGAGMTLPQKLTTVFPGSSSNACTLDTTVSSLTPCASWLVTDRGCSVAQKLNGLALLNGAILLMAPATATSAVEAADPGASDQFEMPLQSKKWWNVNLRSQYVVHLDVYNSNLLTAMIASTGCADFQYCFDSTFLLPPTPFFSAHDTTPESDTLWRIVSATSWIAVLVHTQQATLGGSNLTP